MRLIPVKSQPLTVFITIIMMNMSSFDNGNCMCQFCEAQCNNGLNCSDCRCEGKPVHDIHLCTGFVGDITQYIRNWMRHHGGKADT